MRSGLIVRDASRCMPAAKVMRPVSSTNGHATHCGQVIQVLQFISGIASILTIVSRPRIFSDLKGWSGMAAYDPLPDTTVPSGYATGRLTMYPRNTTFLRG